MTRPISNFDVFLNVLDHGGVVGDGINDDTAGINAMMATAAGQSATLFFPAGDYRTTDTVEVIQPAGLWMHDNALIVYEGASDALVIRGGREKQFRFRATKKPGSQWFNGGETTSVGVRVVDTYRCDLFPMKVYGFGAVGLLLDGDNSPAAYNTIYSPYLEDSFVNLQLRRTTSTGYANQNTFIGGQYRHTSSSLDAGITVPGTKEIDCDGNGNVWVNPSLEGGNVDRSIYCTSAYNSWYSARFEVGPTIEFDNAGGLIPGNALFNLIDVGYAFLADDSSPGSGQPLVIDTGRNNTYRGHTGTKIWSTSSAAYGERYGMRITHSAPNATHPALQISKGETVGGGAETVTAEILHDGRIGMLDTSGTMRYLERPTGAGSATWQ